MGTKKMEPPKHLSERARELWHSVVGPRTPAGRVAAIQTALESLDRADAARRVIDSEGMLSDSYGKIPHSHPLLRVEEASRKLFLTTWRGLGLAKPEQRTSSEMLAELKELSN